MGVAGERLLLPLPGQFALYPSYWHRAGKVPCIVGRACGRPPERDPPLFPIHRAHHTQRYPHRQPHV